MEGYDEKLKSIGRSLDALREEGKERSVKIDKMSEQISKLREDFAGKSAELNHVKQDVKDLRALVWKIVAFLSSGCAAAQYYFANS